MKSNPGSLTHEPKTLWDWDHSWKGHSTHAKRLCSRPPSATRWKEVLGKPPTQPHAGQLLQTLKPALPAQHRLSLPRRCPPPKGFQELTCLPCLHPPCFLPWLSGVPGKTLVVNSSLCLPSWPLFTSPSSIWSFSLLPLAGSRQ